MSPRCHQTLALALLALAACAGCASDQGRRAEREVELLVGEPGPMADAAEDLLVARGRGAIVYLETGLYDADPHGRRRIIKVLVEIGDRDATPILAYLAEHDRDPAVRQAAAEGREKLER